MDKKRNTQLHGRLKKNYGHQIGFFSISFVFMPDV